MLANDGLSNKPKEDRIVKFRDPDDMKDGSHRSVSGARGVCAATIGVL